jgi:multidrug resistance efflux pump
MSHGQVFALILVLSIVVVGALIAVVGQSDIGQAIADAIRHNSGANEGAGVRQELEQMRANVDQLRTEMDEMHGHLLEAHERLDFAERLLARPADGNSIKRSVNA